MFLRITTSLALSLLLFSCENAGDTVKSHDFKSINPDTHDIEPEHISRSLTEITVVEEQESNHSGDGQFAHIRNKDYRTVWQWLLPVAPEMQFFPVKKGGWQTIVGRLGTEITLNTDEFETEDGERNFKLILLEVMDKLSMIKNGVQTVCNERLLESAGAVYVALSNGKKRCRLKQDGKIWMKHAGKLNGNYGIFYSTLDHYGRMTSESGRTRVRQGLALPRDQQYHRFAFTADTSVECTLRFQRMRIPALTWEKTFELSSADITDTADYQEFSNMLFQALGIQTRNFMIPLDGKMVAIEDIDHAVFHLRNGEKESTAELHYRNKNQTFTGETENKPVLLNKTGWVQVARFVNPTEMMNISFTTDLDSGVSAALVYAVSLASNSILLVPWLPENGALETLNLQLPASPTQLISVVKKSGVIYVAETTARRGGKIRFRYVPAGPGFGLDTDLLP